MGAHFEALDKGVLVAALKLTGYFFRIRSTSSLYLANILTRYVYCTRVDLNQSSVLFIDTVSFQNLNAVSIITSRVGVNLGPVLIIWPI